jgi:hypothetical protein
MANTAMTTWTLAGGTDLDKHVGHKIQVTGRSNWDTNMDHSRMTGSTTTPTTATGTPTTSGTTSAADHNTHATQPRLDVQSVKMISPNCS